MSRRRRDTEGEESRTRPKKRNRIVSESSSSEDSDEEMVSDKENTDNEADEEIACSNSKIGMILKMHLRNFMCHDNLVIEFNQNINLLVGVNGSGKSAIITALAVGLGAKAAVTNRSANLKQLIKRGENSATIEIHLNNEGPDGYKPNVYGSKVIVLRTINASGGSYRMKDMKGKVISQKREDLTKILQFMNIQVDNPIVLLNQDAARTFLKDSEPKKLYELFLRATQIDTIIKKLDECHEHTISSKSTLEAKKKALNSKKTELKVLQDRYDLLKSVTSLKAKVAKLKVELAWSKVKELEPAVKEKNKIVERLGAQIKEIVDLIKNKDNLDAEINQKLRDLQQQIGNKQRVLGEEETKFNEIKELITQKDDELVKQERELTKMLALRKRIKEDINQIEETLKEHNAKEVVNLRQEHEKELQKLAAQKDELDVQFANSTRELEMLRNSIGQIEDTYEALKNKRGAIQNNIQKLKGKLQHLRESTNDKYSAYGPHMAKFVERLEKEYQRGKFSQLPRGPLGVYVEVPDRKWRPMVEKITFPLLTAFFVNSENDRFTLTNLLKREFPNIKMPTIITSKFMDKVYDIRQGMVQSQQGAVNLISVIKIKDPVVMNCFIDQLQIETILLTEDQNVAISFSETLENVPDNLSKVVVLKPFSEFYPKPNYRSYSLKHIEHSIIQTNNAELQLQVEADLRYEQEQFNNAEMEIQATRKRLEENRKSLNYHEQQNNTLIKNKRSVENQISELKNFEYPSESAIEVLRNEQVDCTRKLTEIEPMIEECRQLSQGYKEEINELTTQLESFKGTKRNVEKEIQALQSKLDSERNRLYELASNNRTRESQVARLKAEADEANKEMTILTQQYNQEVSVAEKVGVKIPVTKSKADLLKELQTAEARVKELSTSKETPNQLKQEIHVKQQEAMTLDNTIKNLKGTLTFLLKSRGERYQNLNRLKTNMASRVSHKFRMLLKISGYKGNIEFDWVAQELRLKIIPRGQENVVSTNTKALSGGERSFSTVVLLISLWSTIDHPFYFLDEYDVFTDHMNRYVMTTLLIHEAEAKKDQFAFLTPQDMSQFSSKPNLTIHRFADPIRK